MSNTHKITVSMLEFLRTGQFGPVRLGSSRNELRGYLGEPETWGRPYLPRSSAAQAGIWKYGDIEFHFREDTLWLIFADHIRTLKGGKAIDLDPWVLSGNITVKQALRDFEDAGIACQHSIDWVLDDGTERFQVGAGVDLTFADERWYSNPNKELNLNKELLPLAPADMTFHGFSYYCVEETKME